MAMVLDNSERKNQVGFCTLGLEEYFWYYLYITEVGNNITSVGYIRKTPFKDDQWALTQEQG